MHGEDLTAKIEKFILSTGYPFEQRVAHLLREHDWVVFSSVEYIVPPDQQRELDILCYKIINRRRIELRISCKQSSDKHWIFFTEKNRYLKSGSALNTYKMECGDDIIGGIILIQKRQIFTANPKAFMGLKGLITKKNVKF